MEANKKALALKHRSLAWERSPRLELPCNSRKFFHARQRLDWRQEAPTSIGRKNPCPVQVGGRLLQRQGREPRQPSPPESLFFEQGGASQAARESPTRLSQFARRGLATRRIPSRLSREQCAALKAAFCPQRRARLPAECQPRRARKRMPPSKKRFCMRKNLKKQRPPFGKTLPFGRRLCSIKADAH